MSATNAQIEALFEELGLDESFEDLEYGGTLDDLILTFRWVVNPETDGVLETLFGRNFKSIMDVKYFSDSGLDEDDIDSCTDLRTAIQEDPDTGEDITVTTGYGYYTFTKAKLLKMNNERLLEVANRSMSFYTKTDKPCPFDQIITIIVIVVLAVIAAVTGGSTLPLIAGLISVMQVAGVFGDDPETQKWISIGTALMSLGSSYQAFAKAGTSASVMATANFALAIASATVSITTTWISTDLQQALLDEIEEQATIQDEIEALMFEQKFHYTFGASFDSSVREGPEADPYAYVSARYMDYMTYK